MAKRENLEGGKAQFTLSTSEQIALVEILSKISRDKSLTSHAEYLTAGGFAQLFEWDRANIERDVIK